MEIKTDLDLKDKVTVIPLNAKGTITGIFICEDGLQFRVRYFYEGYVRNEYFYADELGSV